MEKDLQLSYQQMALMGSLVYFGICLSSLLVSITFQKMRASYVLSLFMIGNALACFVFASTRNLLLLYLMRLLMGFT